MLTQQQYADAVYAAARANSVLIQSLRTKEALGCYPNWSLAMCQGLKVKSGMWSLRIGDYTSDASVDIYNNLITIGATYINNINLDPNVQINNTIIIINNFGSDFVQSAPINFTNVTTFTIDNYNVGYLPIYGNNPIFMLFTEDLSDPLNPIIQQDTATVPIYAYAVHNDPTSPLVSITWTWGGVTTGYIIISGRTP